LPLAYDQVVNTLPADLAERARAFLRGDIEVAPARHAATVVLLRDGRTGLQVYLLRRTASMVFAAGMHVFPGGSVDARDSDHSPAWAGPSSARWGASLGCTEPLARALVCAAVRETFEESGVLLAGPSAEDLVADTTDDAWERDRRDLLDRSHSLAQLLERRGLVLRSDLLRSWAHWITPEFEPRRFDTRFFVAGVPSGQRARDISGEADDAVWLPVDEAMGRFASGVLAMLPPTIITLRELAAYDCLADVLEADPLVVRVLPRPVLVGDNVDLVVDGPDGEVLAGDLVRTRA
jgi:8-oxo-dGTP pyrophosphatase MutT (NUDIX family)